MTDPLRGATLGAKLRRFLSGIGARRRQDGWVEALRLGGGWAVGFVRRELTAARVRIYDLRRGVDTAADYPGIERPSNPVYDDAVYYARIPPRVFARLMKDAGVLPTEFTFVDLGSGKGAAILMALEVGFRSAVGVELNERLASIAEENIRRHVRRFRKDGEQREVTIVRGDVVDFEFPRSPSLVYMYNPFGVDTLAAVLRRLEESAREHPRDVVIAYVSPRHDHLLDTSPSFERIPTRFRQSAVWKWAIFRSVPGTAQQVAPSERPAVPCTPGGAWAG